MTYSIIVAVYNRPDEMEELLESLVGQTFTDFEVVVVEDGSTRSSRSVCNSFADRLSISYFEKENSGPGPSRNYGCERARGDVFIFVDSDVMVPPHWLASIEAHRSSLDAFGGSDREHASFTVMQKAISYAMTSIFTTGGIRGGKVRVGGTFHPRSFNMGISRAVYDRTGGFAPMRFGEDVDLSMRIIEGGFTTGLIQDAWVFHKRRTDLKKFFRQVFNSGMARINLGIRHPRSTKLVHFFPSAFTSYIVIAAFYAIVLPIGYWTLVPVALYFLIIALHATIKNRSVVVGALSVAASFVQLTGYGLGFLAGIWKRHVLGKGEEYAFGKTFYR